MVKAIFPGTFDPIHFGHIDIANRAADIFDELVVAVYDRPLKKLLFSPEERMQLTRDSFKDKKNITVMGYNTLTVEFAKSIGAKVIVRGLRVFSDFEHEFRMALANRRLEKDIEVFALITSEEHTFLSSTTVREIAALGGNVSTMVPPHVAKALKDEMNLIGDADRMNHHSSLRD
ncbi:MAG: pantetheine-phosphate adenylyltransferase [Chloroflexi bacterium]|nr:pantetheine-phosphate adenylyltransferase [Chloroflexota bacterium]